MLLTEPGLQRYRTYCREHPPQSVSQRRRIVTAFLEKFGKPEVLATEIALPGWTGEVVEELTRGYQDDIQRIGDMPGVRLLTA